MPRNRSHFEIVSNTIPGRMIKLETALPLAIKAVADHNANDSQNFMRSNAPWTDRTGNARQGLFSRAFLNGRKVTIVLWHSVPYGIWLEIAHDRRFKIIDPAWRRCGASVMSDLQHLMAKI